MANKTSRLSEMLGGLIDTLKSRERRVADYLLLREKDILSLSIAEIAESADVSKATVVRFCKALGYTGLKDFKVAYEAGKSIYYREYDLISDQQTDEERLYSLSTGIIRTVEASITKDKALDISDACKEIIKAKSIRLISTEDLGTYTKILEDYITRYCPKIKILKSNDKEKMPELCIGFSLSGVDKTVMDYMSAVMLNGGKAIAITTDNTSLIARAANLCISTCSDELFDDDKDYLARISVGAIVAAFGALLKAGSKK